jgi:uncharacterized lipoprotein YddW (UPF0748 family)
MALRRADLVLLMMAACGDDATSDAGRDAGSRDAGHRDAAGFDAGTDSAVPDDTIEVAHDREFRAIWVATVSNLDFPSSRDLSPAQARAELEAIVDVAVENRLNAIVFQVRPECDALYESELEPWSRYLTGTQGTDPGYDPLAVLIEAAHARAIEVHAWLNPYRASTSTTAATAPNHVTRAMPENVRTYGSLRWLDPGVTAVQEHVAGVVADILARYEVDGIHLDDYFYPYPEAGVDFPDQAAFDAYRAGGGTLSRGDWRRDNVNVMVARLHDTVLAGDPDVRFGISPFGIYRPGMPPGITGLDQYAAIFADPVHWMEQGDLDYIAPQLYWPTTRTAQAYEPLLEWWTDVVPGHHVFVGNYFNQLGSAADWSADEFERQVEITRAMRDRGALGNIFFTLDPFVENRMGIAERFRDRFYDRPALTPPIARVDRTVEAPSVVAAASGVAISHPSSDLRGFVVYREEGTELVVQRIVGPDTTDLTLTPGNYAITAVDRASIESRGRPVTVE